MVYGQTDVEIAVKQGTRSEILTKEQLQRLLATYVSPWIYTKSILIDERSIPPSHPVLTLHTRHTKDDELLLSAFAHEQLRWFLAAKADATRMAVMELRETFPKVPVGAGPFRQEEAVCPAVRISELPDDVPIRCDSARGRQSGARHFDGDERAGHLLCKTAHVGEYHQCQSGGQRPQGQLK